MDRPNSGERAFGWAAWAIVAILLVAILGSLGCAQHARCAVQAEQVQHVGQNSAGDVVQVRSFIELCKAAI